MDSEQLADLVAKLRLVGAETPQVEVKSAARAVPKNLPETLSAFSNGAGGTVILGLSETDGFELVAGFKPTAIRDGVTRICNDELSPPVRAHVDLVAFEEGAVVVAEIPPLQPRDKPCFVKKRGLYQGSFIRTGDGDHRLSSYEIDRLKENREQPAWDQEVVNEAALTDLDEHLWGALLDRERKAHPRIFGNCADLVALQRLRIVGRWADGELHPTLAGLLSLGTFPQEFFPRLTVTYAVYPGTSKSSTLTGQRFLDSGTLAGPIPGLVGDGVGVVARNMRVGGVIAGVFRQDLVDYPLVAVREALTNALMHRDYSPETRGTQVQLNIFADRLEIVNPGGLFGTVTLATLGKDGISSARNQFLARVLEVTPYPDGGFVAENRGSGYQEILSQLERDMLPPPIPRDALTSFSLTFERRRMTDAERGAASGHSSREQVLNYLADHATATSRELAATAGISLGGTRRVLTDLLAEGLVDRLEPARSPKQRYRLAE